MSNIFATSLIEKYNFRFLSVFSAIINAFGWSCCAEIVQVNAMKAGFQITERSLSYAKIVQVNAMKAGFQIAERSLSYAKIAN